MEIGLRQGFHVDSRFLRGRERKVVFGVFDTGQTHSNVHIDLGLIDLAHRFNIETIDARVRVAILIHDKTGVADQKLFEIHSEWGQDDLAGLRFFLGLRCGRLTLEDGLEIPHSVH